MTGPVRLTDWACLGVVAGGPTHGWAVAAEMHRDGELGRIWHASKGATYRSLDGLAERGWLKQVGDEVVAGPPRVLLAITDVGWSELTAWLERPVDHLREVRSALLVKLTLHRRLRRSPATLLLDQRRAVDEVIDRLTQVAGEHGDGHDGDLVADWRLEYASAVRRFVDARLNELDH